MSVSSRFVLQQGPMLATLGRTAVRALAQQFGQARTGAPVIPSPVITRTMPPPASSLIDAYIAHLGGDPRSYKGSVPPHFFPQWSVPVAAETLAGVPYPIVKVLNAGCRMEINARIPRGEPLEVRAQLTSIDDDGRRAILTQRIVTSTASAPDALVCEVYALVPLRGGNGNGSRDKSAEKPKASDKPRVPEDAEEIGSVRLAGDAGLSFAKLTGDFNPIHWIPAAAKASGFRNVILHGFGTFARACEGLNKGLFGGDVTRLRNIDVKFTRPLVLPHEVGIFVLGQPAREVFVGDAKGGPAYMTGRFETGDKR